MNTTIMDKLRFPTVNVQQKEAPVKITDETVNKTGVSVKSVQTAETVKSEQADQVVQVAESEQTEQIAETEQSVEVSKPKIDPNRKPVCVCKIGSDHIKANMNNHDFAFVLPNMKVVLDGCGSGKHSEVGTRIFGQLLARKAKDFIANGITINTSNFIGVVETVFLDMLKLCNDTKFIFENYCFTILACFEFEDEFTVFSCGDGYIIKETSEGIEFEELDDGEYPAYYIYNFITDKSELKEYKDGVSFKVSHFSKDEYINVGVASDGLRFTENLLSVEKTKLMDSLHEGKGKKIEVLINRNNKHGMFHDDISICF